MSYGLCVMGYALWVMSWEAEHVKYKYTQW